MAAGPARDRPSPPAPQAAGQLGRNWPKSQLPRTRHSSTFGSSVRWHAVMRAFLGGLCPAALGQSQNHPLPRSSGLVIIPNFGSQLLGDVVHQHGQQLLLQGLAAHDQRGQLHGVCPVQVPHDGGGFVKELLLLGRGQLH